MFDKAVRPLRSYITSSSTRLIEDALGLQGVGIKTANGRKLCDFDYADNFVCLLEFMQQGLNRLARVATLFGMYFEPQTVKCCYKTGRQYYRRSHSKKKLTINERFSYLGNSLTKNGSRRAELGVCIYKTRET